MIYINIYIHTLKQTNKHTFTVSGFETEKDVKIKINIIKKESHEKEPPQQNIKKLKIHADDDNTTT